MQSAMLLSTNILVHLESHTTIRATLTKQSLSSIKIENNIFQLGLTTSSHQIEVTHLKFHITLRKVPTPLMTFASRKTISDKQYKGIMQL